MNKKISLVTLGLSLSSIVILTGAMIISQPKYTLKNIVGKQSSLGDVVVYSQSKRGIYSNDSVILSKDKYQFNKNVNQNPDLYIQRILIKIGIYFQGIYMIQVPYIRMKIV